MSVTSCYFPLLTSLCCPFALSNGLVVTRLLRNNLVNTSLILRVSVIQQRKRSQKASNSQQVTMATLQRVNQPNFLAPRTSIDQNQGCLEDTWLAEAMRLFDGTFPDWRSNNSWNFLGTKLLRVTSSPTRHQDLFRNKPFHFSNNCSVWALRHSNGNFSNKPRSWEMKKGH